MCVFVSTCGDTGVCVGVCVWRDCVCLEGEMCVCVCGGREVFMYV